MGRKFDLQLFADGAGDQSGAGVAGVGGTETGSGAPGQGGQGTGDTNTGGERMIPESRVQEIVRQRIAETHAGYKDHDRYKGLAERITKVTGLDLDTLQSQLDTYTQAHGLPKQDVGQVSPQVLNQISATQVESQKTLEKVKDLELSMEEQRLLTNPMYSHLKDSKEALNGIKEHAKKTGTSLEQAYWSLQGPTRIQQLEREVEQRVMADLQNRLAHGGVLTDTSGELKTLGLTDLQLGAARVLGIDPQDYADAASSGNIDEWRAKKAARATKK